MKPGSFIYLIEWYIQGRWQTTVGAALSRDDARREISEWRENNPTDRFRIKKYMAFGEVVR